VRVLAARLCLLGLLVAVPATAADPPVENLADGRTGKIYFESVTPTGFFQLAKRETMAKTVIFGTLSLPKKATAPMPAMVIAHGSGGVSHDREFWWADHFNDIGVAAFVVDSFTPRNIRETATDQTQLSTAANVADALVALRLLATHPKLDAKRHRRHRILQGRTGRALHRPRAVPPRDHRRRTRGSRPTRRSIPLATRGRCPTR
jgi:hypothetical protein